MARVIVYLREPEMNALETLAQREYRAPRAQAALIIRKELERLGMIVLAQTGDLKEEASPWDLLSEKDQGSDGVAKGSDLQFRRVESNAGTANAPLSDSVRGEA